MCVETWCIKYDEIAKQNVSQVSRGKVLPVKYSQKPAVTICHDSSHSSHVLSTWLHFTGSLLVSYPWKLLWSSMISWVFTLSHTQPIQRNPTNNTGYIRLNRITIKFSMKLKSTQNSCKSQFYSIIKVKRYCG